ncbi:hypothetical protein [Deinococcus altitudinis]|uniref:hypothetical protein n=1 Tax=Deinococcus altitudinis TaxID=468914 RepID=UPI003891E312
MIDGFLNTLRKTGERVQRRGEEVTQAARLRLDIFQLGREQGEMYARLGRAYHSNASVSALEEIRAEIARVDEEIAAREKLIAELGADLKEEAASTHPADPGVNLSKAPASATTVGPATINPTNVAGLQPIPAEAPTALSVWREKEATRMTDQDKNDALTTGPATDATGRPDGENADPTTTAGGDPHSTPFTSHPGGQAQATNPNEAGDPEKLQPTPNTASAGNEAAREELFRHKNHLEEGQRASRDPDPLANKD